MRRKDRDCGPVVAGEILRDCEYAVLATVNPDGTPYCIPISPVVMDGMIYFHCALEGQKLDNIRANSAVCLTCTRNTRVVPEELTADFECAVIKGHCVQITDEAEKTAALRALCGKYSPGYPDTDAAIARLLHVTGICRITIDEITGKRKMGL